MDSAEVNNSEAESQKGEMTHLIPWASVGVISLTALSGLHHPCCLLRRPARKKVAS